MDNAAIDSVVLSVLALIVFGSLWRHATRMDRDGALRPAAPAPVPQPAPLPFTAPAPAPAPMVPAPAPEPIMVSMQAQPSRFRADLKHYLWKFGKFILILYAVKAALIGVWVMSPEGVAATKNVITIASIAIASIFCTIDWRDLGVKMKSRRRV